LLNGTGRCGDLFNLVLCYENADWAGITKYAESLGIPLSIITQKYFECVETVNTTWRNLMMPYPEQGTKEDEAHVATQE